MAGAIAFIVVGVLLIALGLAGAAGDWGSSTTTKAVAAAPTTTATTTTATTVAPETPEEFITRLDQALRARDIEYMIARLHPAVIERYGEAACRANFERTESLARKVTGAATGPAPYDWTTDGQTETIPDTYTVPVPAGP